MNQTAYKTVRPTKSSTICIQPLSATRKVFEDLFASSLILVEEWERVPVEEREALLDGDDASAFLEKLVGYGLLTSFQADRIRVGKLYGLLLGNYRVLSHIGTGGMGIVYKAEHLMMRRLAAIKVLEPARGQDHRVLTRFLSEMRAVAQLNHPNIVAAFDAGKLPCPDVNVPPLYYLVMEYVPGEDLEEYVVKHGPLSPSFACDLMYQISSALGEAHKHQLVHRDLKPSNVMITPENQAKLLDFGLVHHLRSNITQPKLTLGTIDFMAPEQVSNASSVDIRADIYALGGTLYWCLTGTRPFVSEGSFGEALLQRLTLPAPSVRNVQPDLPAELDAVIMRMMARDPRDRYSTPQAVSRALAPFLRPEIRQQLVRPARPASEKGQPADAAGANSGSRVQRVLAVDDERTIRDLCCQVLQAHGLECEQAQDGLDALNLVRAKPFDLLLVDVDMPEMDGATLCRILRDDPPCPNLKIVMVSGRASSDEMAKMLQAGADDYITKPFSLTQLVARVQSELRLKEAQDRADQLNRELLVANQHLHDAVGDRHEEQTRARDALVLALAQCVEYRDGETPQHLLRLQRYTRCLAEEAAKDARFAGQINQDFLDTMHCCVPLHDLGKIRLPDHILLKPDKLTADERIQVQAHTVIGAETLQEVAGQQGTPLAFLHMAIDIARHHHEHYDGTGYPDGLAGAAIPLAARLTGIADVYDALRLRRVYKPALAHEVAMRLIVENSPGQFDPALVEALQRCGSEFDRILRELPD